MRGLHLLLWMYLVLTISYRQGSPSNCLPFRFTRETQGKSETLGSDKAHLFYSLHQQFLFA